MIFVKTCLDLQQRFVEDNTNPTLEERARYISLAKAKKIKIIGYFFESDPASAILRNSMRTGKERIKEVGIYGTYSRLERPNYKEGFDQLFRVRIESGNLVQEILRK